MQRRRDGFAYSVVDLLVVLLVIFLARSIDTSDTAAAAKGAVSAGNLTVQMTWDSAVDADVDLWCLGPDEPHAVGFNAPHGRHFDLVRDDLGRPATRKAGTWRSPSRAARRPERDIVNAMLYVSHDGKLPVHVHIEVVNGHND